MNHSIQAARSNWRWAAEVRTIIFLAALGSTPLLCAQLGPLLPDDHQIKTAPAVGAESQTVITGRVVDATGAVVAGAKVSLAIEGGSVVVTGATGTDGSFAIAVGVPGAYRITVTAQGFADVSTSAEVKADQTVALPEITLAVAALATQIQVTANASEIATEQLRAQEKQRIFGAIPNFYTSYYQNTAPLRPKQKLELASKFTIDPASFAITGIIAGVEQANNDFRGYGQGAQGYGKRYAAAYGNFLTGVFLSGAVLPSLLKQDPRYFYKGSGTNRSRVLYALANSVVCKGDNGRWQANYSAILGGLASGGISNLYYPAKDRNGAGLTFENAGIGIAASAAANLVQEFVFKKLTPHLPKNPPATP